MAGPDQLQLQIALPFRDEPRRHPAVRRYLDAGYRIVEFLRSTDKEALVTLAPPPPSADISGAR